MANTQALCSDPALRSLDGMLPDLEALYKDVHSHPELSDAGDAHCGLGGRPASSRRLRSNYRGRQNRGGIEGADPWTKSGDGDCAWSDDRDWRRHMVRDVLLAEIPTVLRASRIWGTRSISPIGLRQAYARGRRVSLMIGA